jgi:hypothetical protein
MHVIRDLWVVLGYGQHSRPDCLQKVLKLLTTAMNGISLMAGHPPVGQ